MGILIIDTGIKRNTAKMVKIVSDLYSKFPKVVDKIFESMNQISLESIENLENFENLEEEQKEEKIIENLQQLTELSHCLLNSLGVGHPKITEITQICNEFGIKCKITGAGGGGCCFCLFSKNQREKIEKIMLKLNQIKIKSFITSLDKEGAILI
eukprot:Anaeramoba_ignava/c13598_g1_i1.p2 GENE.c13598_g1_i1~~c13598_g1_i1.p2  ORF type:complete len:155 (+),score=44.46 c13598_g1_i1:564-1028(+)